MSGIKTELVWAPFEDCPPPERRDLVVHAIDHLAGGYSVLHRFLHGYWSNGEFITFGGNVIKPSPSVKFKHWALPTIPASEAAPFLDTNWRQIGDAGEAVVEKERQS